MEVAASAEQTMLVRRASGECGRGCGGLLALLFVRVCVGMRSGGGWRQGGIVGEYLVEELDGLEQLERSVDELDNGEQVELALQSACTAAAAAAAGAHLGQRG